MIYHPKPIGNVDCHVDKLVAIIGNKRNMLILKELFFGNGPIRFSEFLRSLKPVSSRTLSLKLKKFLKY